MAALKRTWWDRWEDEMHFQPPAAAPESSALVAGALATLLVVGLLFAGVIGTLLEAHASVAASLVLMTLVSLAALVSVDARTETH